MQFWTVIKGITVKKVMEMFHRYFRESPPSSSEDLKFKNDADLPEFIPPNPCVLNGTIKFANT
jgi:hypothetical protein